MATNNPTTIDNSAPGGDRGAVNVIYILYLVGIAVGLTAIIGLIMAYSNKDAAPEWLKSHYRNQIHIFWKGLLYGFAGMMLIMAFVGYLVIFAAMIWYVLRVIQGMQALSRGEAIARPDAWGLS